MTELGTPFYNKIFFCDIVGYSRLHPGKQVAAQSQLKASVEAALRQLGARLEEDVIALPTGDGMALNFLAPAPDAHLQAALLVLDQLRTAPDFKGPFELRVGLNSHADAWVLDVNGKRNVVGRGINMAQRVMDLGRDAQLLMHDRIRSDLDSLEAYRDRIVHIGDFTVKHGEILPVAQFLDPARPYISNERAQPRPPAGGQSVSDLIRARQNSTLLHVTLGSGDRDAVPIVEDHVLDHLDRFGSFQSLKVAASWVVAEMLDNGFTHAGLEPQDHLELRLDRTPRDLRISVEQPNRGSFDLRAILSNPDKQDSFMQLMRNAGLQWSAALNGGNVILELAVPLDFRIPDPPASAQSDPARHPLVAAFHAGRVDETNWEDFSQWVIGQAQAAAEQGVPLVLDLRAIGYMSSRGLRALTLARRATPDVDITLAGVGERLAEIFSISRYDRLFRVLRD